MDLVHIDICDPFPTTSWNDHEYFVTFTDNYSRYGYLYLLYEKSQTLNMIKIYKAEVENQLNRKIKTIRSDPGGEYYGRYDGSGRYPDHLPISKRVWHCRLVHHAPDTSSKGVTER